MGLVCNKHPREPICQNLIKLIKLNELEFQLAITNGIIFSIVRSIRIYYRLIFSYVKNLLKIY